MSTKASYISCYTAIYLHVSPRIPTILGPKARDYFMNNVRSALVRK